MALKKIRLELARNKDFPEGSPYRGYIFKAPLNDEGELEAKEWRANRQDCTVLRFWEGEDDENGHLAHHRNGNWVFHYDNLSDDDDEPIFKFDRHHFIPGEYVSITEHDGEQLTFKVVRVD